MKQISEEKMLLYSQIFEGIWILYVIRKKTYILTVGGI